MARPKKEKQPLIPEYQAFIAMLVAEREAKKIDQKVLAKILGCSTGAYSRKENGITPITLHEALLLQRFFRTHNIQFDFPAKHDPDIQARLDKVIRIFSSSDTTSIKALKENIDAFLEAEEAKEKVKTQDTKIAEQDKKIEDLERRIQGLLEDRQADFKPVLGSGGSSA